MAQRESIKKDIIIYPEHYFALQSKSLDSRIAEVHLSKEKINEISSTHIKKFIRDKALGIFKIGEIVSEIINWNESVDEDLKEQAELLFNDLGLNMTSAINVFLRQAVNEQAIPFEIRKINSETLQALKDVENGNLRGSFSSVKELMEDLNA